MSTGDLTDGVVVEGALLSVAIDRDAADGRPRLGEDAVLSVQGLQLLLLEVGVHLDLVHRRHDIGLGQEAGELVGHEVRHPDRTHPAIGVELFQRAVSAQGAVEALGQGLVEQEQVDLVDAELLGGLLEPVEGLVVAVVADPQLRLDEHLTPVKTGVPDGVADTGLVAVGGGGVDVPIPDPQRLRHCGRGLLGRRLEDPEPERGQRDLIVQSDRWNSHTPNAKHQTARCGSHYCYHPDSPRLGDTGRDSQPHSERS